MDFKRSFIAKGLYFQQLQKWFNIFSEKQIHVIFTEELRDNPEDVMKGVYKFLELDDFSIKSYEKRKKFDYDSMDKDVRTELSKYYESENKQLFELVKRVCWS